MFLSVAYLVTCTWLVSYTAAISTDVSHVTLRVSSLPRSLIFYQRLLGGKLMEDISSVTPVQGDDYQSLFGDGTTDLTTGGTHQVCSP